MCVGTEIRFKKDQNGLGPSGRGRRQTIENIYLGYLCSAVALFTVMLSRVSSWWF